MANKKLDNSLYRVLVHGKCSLYASKFFYLLQMSYRRNYFFCTYIEGGSCEGKENPVQNN